MPPSRFHLEHALSAWRRSLAHNRAFTPDDLEELERHIRDQVAGLVYRGMAEEAAFRQAVHEIGGYGLVEGEYQKVYWGKLKRRCQVLTELNWCFIMLKNYVKTALRTMRRHAGYTFINLFGLTIGIACCLLIGLYVRHEWSYDSFHENADRLYRVVYESRLGENLPPAAPEQYQAWGMAPLGPALEADFPEIEHAVRLSGRHQVLLSRDDRNFQEERYFFADSTFFEAFSFPLLAIGPACASAADWQGRHRRTPGRAVRRGSGIASPHSAHSLRLSPAGSWLRARSMASFTVASICSWTAPSCAQPVAMLRSSPRGSRLGRT
jgi:hypothetical protein